VRTFDPISRLSTIILPSSMLESASHACPSSSSNPLNHQFSSNLFTQNTHHQRYQGYTGIQSESRLLCSIQHSQNLSNLTRKARLARVDIEPGHPFPECYPEVARWLPENHFTRRQQRPILYGRREDRDFLRNVQRADEVNWFSGLR
jgi:hypothetical protein